MTTIWCRIKSHGGPDIETPIDMMEIAQFLHRSGTRGTLLLVDGSIVPIENALEVLEQLMMDVQVES